MGPHTSAWRKGLTAVAATLLAAIGLAVSPTAANAAVACQVTYTRTWEGGNGFGVQVRLQNLGDPVNNWRITYSYSGSQTLQNGWEGNWSQSGQNITIAAPDYAPNLAANGVVQPGANFTFTGTNTNPTAFSLNGTPCTGQPQTQSLVVTPTSVSVASGSTATYSVRLSSAPTSNVTVTSTAASGGDTGITVTGGASLTFTSANWQTPQNVTVTGATGGTAGTRTINVASSGLTTVPVTVTRTAVATQSLVVSPTSVSVASGSTATYSVRLATAPSGNVTVTSTAASTGDTGITVTGGASLTFTTSNWQTAQNVTVTGATGGTPGTRTINVASSGLTTVPVTVTRTAVATQSLVVSPTSVSVTSGSTATYSVRLAIAPSGNVTVTSTAASSGDTGITVTGGASLTFTTSNWQTAQNVTVTGASGGTPGTRTINVASSGLTTVPVTVTRTTGGTYEPHQDNPYVGAEGYVNPDWRASANAEPGGSRIANTATGVWLDRIAAITSGSAGNNSKGLRDHLDLALQQDAANGSTKTVFQVVIYNLPNRDCSALASNGELKISENGLNRYKTEYIDVIAGILADPKYAPLRIVAIIEIDSLPNLVTNLNLAACQEAKNTGAYEQGVAYALGKLHAIPNVYNYVDAGHHGWLGWDTNFGPSSQLFASTAASATGGRATVDGFITNTANYSALVEPYFTINSTVNGQTVRQSRWVDWNFYVDELSYAQAFRNRLIQDGFSSNIGMLIDTSRNGWGGPNRPTGPSTSTDLNTFVNQSKIDRRIHAGNWCNQSGAGLGERPRTAPAAGIDAYVWIKPPGESDGSSSAIPNDEGKGFDRMCDPTYGGNDRNGNNATGALANAPISGHWFSAQFRELMANAYPPL
ncbi:glycoside hydrolase family 6 protein [Acrocarpospora catenulata]|uniref:glycoside hydrolase family 6 protein n=1 Tax=Acrocarpospora catenulata TaxID=2836182 RepID=UPI001BDB6918|nr:glycoside hydrolase family 6 protein [Acrocarpospora catenulata]